MTSEKSLKTMSPNPLSSVVIVYTSDGCIVMANRLVSDTAAQGLTPFILPCLTTSNVNTTPLASEPTRPAVQQNSEK